MNTGFSGHLYRSKVKIVQLVKKLPAVYGLRVFTKNLQQVCGTGNRLPAVGISLQHILVRHFNMHSY
jgi:hypothetical protein